MIVFVLLILLFFAAHSPFVARRFRLVERRDKAAWALGLTLVVAGLLHFIKPASFLAMMPPWLPWPEAMVALSGAAEITVGIGLLVRALRPYAAWGAVALLVAVFPANIHAAVSGAPIPDYPSSPLYRWLRLPMQLVLIGWAVMSRPRPG